MNKAWKLFDEMPQRTTTSYNAMIKLWLIEQFVVGGRLRDVFSAMPENNHVRIDGCFRVRDV